MDFSVRIFGYEERAGIFAVGGILLKVVVLGGLKDARDCVNTVLDLVHFQQMTIIISSPSCAHKPISILIVTQVSHCRKKSREITKGEAAINLVILSNKEPCLETWAEYS